MGSVCLEILMTKVSSPPDEYLMLWKHSDLISRAIKTCQLRLMVNYSCVLQLVLIGGRASVMMNNGSAGSIFYTDK